MAYTPCYPNKINWQNEPSEATALNDVNLNKMDSAIYTIDGRVVDMSTRLDDDDTAITNLQGDVSDLQGDMSDAQDDITDLQSGKVDKETGKELSTNDFTNAYKTKLDTIPANASHVEIEQVVTEGTTLANITIDGTTTAIKGSDIEVDEELSPTSTNPVENKAIYDALNNLLPSKTVRGNPISISDASGFNAKALKITMNPIQDLHGYSNPWVGGAGNNKMPSLVAGTYEVDGLKAVVNENGLVTVTGTKNVSGSVSIDIPFEKSFNLSSATYIHLRNSYASANIALDWGVGGWYFSMTPANRIIAPNNLEGITRLRLYHSSVVTEALNYTLQPSIETTNSVTDWTPYSNICPISGRTEVSVKRTGKNLVEDVINDASVNPAGNVYRGSDTTVYKLNLARIKAGVTYTISTVDTYDGFVGGYFETKPTINSTAYSGRILTSNKTFTAPIDGWVAFRSNLSCTTAQLEQGNTATDYEPYTAETKTHQYSETVYGGVDDFVNGGATSTKKYIELDENSNWEVGAGAVWFFIGGDSDLPTGTIIDSRLCSNMFKNGYNQDDSIWVIYKQIHIRPNSTIAPSGATAEGLAEFKNWLSTNNYKIQVCVELATPTTISTSAENITLLKGNNVLSTNADDMELKYSLSLDSLLPTTTRTLAKSTIVEEPKEETDETEER